MGSNTTDRDRGVSRGVVRYLNVSLEQGTIKSVEDFMPERDDKRQAKITPEHLLEARRLRKLWIDRQALRESNGAATQEQFGLRYNIGNQAAVGFFLSGKTPLSMKAALGFATGLRCRVREFSPRLAEQVDAYEQAIGASEQEQSILDALRRISPLQRERVMGMLEAWGSSGEFGAPSAVQGQRRAK